MIGDCKSGYGWIDGWIRYAGGVAPTNWTAGPYTALLYSAENVLSGDWSDSVVPLTAAAINSPVYQVQTGSGLFGSWKGIRMTVNTGVNSEGHFFTDSVTVPALAANENAVIQAVIRFETGQFYECAFSDHAGATPGYLSCWCTGASTGLDGYFYFRDDAATSKVCQYNRGALQLVPPQTYKVRCLVDRTTNKVQVYEDGNHVGVDLDITGLGAITPTKISLGAFANATGEYPLLGLLYAMKVDKSTDAAVLLVNDFGE